MIQPKILALHGLVAALLASGGVSAHISISSGPATANKSQEVAFSVGHGCEGADTSAVTVEIPAGVTSVRPMSSDFGRVEVTTDDAGVVTAVTWTKIASTVLPADIAFYKLVVRLKTPDQAFTTLFFPAHQTCTDAEGNESSVDWVALEDTPDAEPAPSLVVVAPRYPGWNKLTVSEDISDLAVYFADAQIVWKGDSAYSINPTTVELIGQTEGVTPLSSLRAKDEIWVRY
jgi:periplasmic copper chaperone A